MIVKNEQHVLYDTLVNVCAHIPITSYAISDTGSSDGTKRIITEFFESRSIPGNLYDDPWVDFGHNRTVVLRHAYNTSDYVLMWDADDRIDGVLRLPEPLNADQYKLQFMRGSIAYRRCQLFNNRLRWRYVGVLHEYLECIEVGASPTSGFITGQYSIAGGCMGARSLDPLKYHKDAAMLTRAFADVATTDASLANMYAFYCANSYRDADDPEQAAKWYRITLARPGTWEQNRYVSSFELHAQYCKLGKPHKGIRHLWAALALDTTRVECALELIKHYCVNKQYVTAMAAYSVIAPWFEAWDMNVTSLCSRQFARKADYTFYLPYHLIYLAHWVHNLPLGARMLRRILHAQHVAPQWYVHNLFHNANLYVDTVAAMTDGSGWALLQDMLAYVDAASRQGVTLASVHLATVERFIDCERPRLVAAVPDGSAPPAAVPIAVWSYKRPRIVLTTTCKEWRLLQQTVNSLLHTWTDVAAIDAFLCVDENSSDADRAAMVAAYPFMTFVMKTPTQRGHCVSMNILRNTLMLWRPQYWVHIEDDWLFFRKGEYVTKAIQTLESPEARVADVRQVLFNRNYALRYAYYTRPGGSSLNADCVLHDPNTQQHCLPHGAWPHYSLQPSVVDAQAVLGLAPFEGSRSFERNHADKYAQAGYTSAFFDTISCQYIGEMIVAPSAFTSHNVIQPVYETCTSGEWVFYEFLDSVGGDVGQCLGWRPALELKQAAAVMSNALAVNSAGYVKSRVRFPLTAVRCLATPGSGLYIKQLRVKMLCNWCSSAQLCNEWNKMTRGDFKWNGISIVADDATADYYLVINHPQYEDTHYVADKTLVYHLQPWHSNPLSPEWALNTWAEPDPTRFYAVHTRARVTNTPFWKMSWTWTDFKTKDIHKDLAVANVVSSVCTEGADAQQVDFLKALEMVAGVHVFGDDNTHGFKGYQGTVCDKTKAQAIMPYQYHLAFERGADNFISEKLWEALLSETLCFYCGCPNVSEVIDPRALICLDPTDATGSIAAVMRAIADGEWEKRLPFIREEKRRILDDIAFFPTLQRLLYAKPTYNNLDIIIHCHQPQSDLNWLTTYLPAACTHFSSCQVIVYDESGDSTALSLDWASAVRCAGVTSVRIIPLSVTVNSIHAYARHILTHIEDGGLGLADVNVFLPHDAFTKTQRREFMETVFATLPSETPSISDILTTSTENPLKHLEVLCATRSTLVAQPSELYRRLVTGQGSGLDS
jgi:hypothetical protein